MSFCVREGWLEGVWPAGLEKIPSPNCDRRPEGEEVSLLVIHAISLPPGTYGGSCISDFFCNRLDVEGDPYFKEIQHLQVSSHFLIDRHGKIIQYVPLHLRAWHAGLSLFEGRSRCNDFSIGIELEGMDDQPFESGQYDTLAELTRCVMTEYPAISKQRIVGHCHIAPERKTDPGPCFDWPHYLAAV